MAVEVGSVLMNDADTEERDDRESESESDTCCGSRGLGRLVASEDVSLAWVLLLGIVVLLCLHATGNGNPKARLELRKTNTEVVPLRPLAASGVVAPTTPAPVAGLTAVNATTTLAIDNDSVDDDAVDDDAVAAAEAMAAAQTDAEAQAEAELEVQDEATEQEQDLKEEVLEQQSPQPPHRTPTLTTTTVQPEHKVNDRVQQAEVDNENNEDKDGGDNEDGKLEEGTSWQELANKSMADVAQAIGRISCQISDKKVSGYASASEFCDGRLSSFFRGECLLSQQPNDGAASLESDPARGMLLIKLHATVSRRIKVTAVREWTRNELSTHTNRVNTTEIVSCRQNAGRNTAKAGRRTLRVVHLVRNPFDSILSLMEWYLARHLDGSLHELKPITGSNLGRGNSQLQAELGKVLDNHGRLKLSAGLIARVINYESHFVFWNHTQHSLPRYLVRYEDLKRDRFGTFWSLLRFVLGTDKNTRTPDDPARALLPDTDNSNSNVICNGADSYRPALFTDCVLSARLRCALGDEATAYTAHKAVAFHSLPYYSQSALEYVTTQLGPLLCAHFRDVIKQQYDQKLEDEDEDQAASAVRGGLAKVIKIMGNCSSRRFTRDMSQDKSLIRDDES